MKKTQKQSSSPCQYLLRHYSAWKHTDISPVASLVLEVVTRNLFKSENFKCNSLRKKKSEANHPICFCLRM
jgi:hypothetical protein